ncbi:MAG: cyclodeaminase/cyclohydrolase family protein [Candidatus Omnitrophota bacterium]
MKKNLLLNKYLDDLASSLPTPGGGSASALAGCLGTGLLCMVGLFSTGKKFKDTRSKTKKILEDLENIRNNLKLLVFLDTEAYNLVVLARNLDNGVKIKAYEECVNISNIICQNCYNAIALARQLVKVSNFYLISDLEAGVYLLEAAFKSANLFMKENNDAVSALRGKASGR